jgi:hypothetical protein
LTVDRAVWDSVRRFSPGDWVEITDDWREFSGQPGEIRQVHSVDDSSRTVTLEAALTAGLFPVDGQNLTDSERHTRIKRWDQDPGGPAVIDVPASTRHSFWKTASKSPSRRSRMTVLFVPAITGFLWHGLRMRRLKS